MASSITPGRIAFALAIVVALLLVGGAIAPAAVLQLAVRVGLLAVGIGVVLALRPAGRSLF